MINHLISILISIFISGYHGKTTDFAKNSSCHRTTIAHFLNSGKWDDSFLSDTLPSFKATLLQPVLGYAPFTENTQPLLGPQSFSYKPPIPLRYTFFLEGLPV